MAITYVKSASAIGSSPQTATFSSNYSVGNWLIGGFITTPNDVLSSVTGGGTWIQDVSEEGSTSFESVYIERVARITTASTTVVAACTGGTLHEVGLAVGEFAGVVSLMAGSAQGATGTTTSPATPTITGVPAGALVIVTANTDAAGSTYPAGYSTIYGTNWAVNGEDVSYQITSSAGSVSATWTAGSSSNWETAIAVYLPTPNSGFMSFMGG